MTKARSYKIIGRANSGEDHTEYRMADSVEQAIGMVTGKFSVIHDIQHVNQFKAWESCRSCNAPRVKR